MVRVLILGSNEYPLGVSTDPIPSGGIEIYWQRHAPILRDSGVSVTILTRRFSGVPRVDVIDAIRVIRIPWIPGKLFITPTFAIISAVWLIFHGNAYDVLVSNGPWATFFANLVKMFHRKKVLHLPHGVAYIQPQYLAWSRFFHKIVEKVDCPDTVLVIVGDGPERDNLKHLSTYLGIADRVIFTG